jgi:hypothetical protein
MHLTPDGPAVGGIAGLSKCSHEEAGSPKLEAERIVSFELRALSLELRADVALPSGVICYF